MHHPDGLANGDGSLHHADITDHPFVAVVEGIENQRPGRRLLITLWRRNELDNAIEHFLHIQAALGGHLGGVVRLNANDLLDFMDDFVGAGTGQIHLVDDRQNLQIVFGGR